MMLPMHASNYLPITRANNPLALMNFLADPTLTKGRDAADGDR
jgi:hypothetical protein